MNNCLRQLFVSNSLKNVVYNHGKGHISQFRHGSNVAQLFKSASLVKPDGGLGKGNDLLKDKLTALYFSASWCGPCKQFTPHLKTFYDKVNKDGKQFEVIFVSLDRDEKSMERYYEEHMGKWLRTEYSSDLIHGLAEECGVTTIPALKIVNENGDILKIRAREDIMKNGGDDIEGLLQRWKKIAV
uniref:protein-disulfide reductase n=1 Tax=Strongyloides papillosus TaxID=174720 RepID=A0A0N5BE57_STREA